MTHLLFNAGSYGFVDSATYNELVNSGKIEPTRQKVYLPIYNSEPAESRYGLIYDSKLTTKNNLFYQCNLVVVKSCHGIVRLSIQFTSKKSSSLLAQLNDKSIGYDNYYKLVSAEENECEVEVPFLIAKWIESHHYEFEEKSIEELSEILRMELGTDELNALINRITELKSEIQEKCNQNIDDSCYQPALNAANNLFKHLTSEKDPAKKNKESNQEEKLSLCPQSRLKKITNNAEGALLRNNTHSEIVELPEEYWTNQDENMDEFPQQEENTTTIDIPAKIENAQFFITNHEPATNTDYISNNNSKDIGSAPGNQPSFSQVNGPTYQKVLRRIDQLSAHLNPNQDNNVLNKDVPDALNQEFNRKIITKFMASTQSDAVLKDHEPTLQMIQENRRAMGFRPGGNCS